MGLVSACVAIDYSDAFPAFHNLSTTGRFEQVSGNGRVVNVVALWFARIALASARLDTAAGYGYMGMRGDLVNRQGHDFCAAFLTQLVGRQPGASSVVYGGPSL